MRPLQGTLEAVLLQKPHNDDTTALGIIERNGQTIYVVNGTPYLNQETILVRTDSATNRITKHNIPTLTAQTGNFVAVEIPPEMKDGLYLKPGEYILTGIFPWTGPLPNLDHINTMFDPGRMGYLPFFPVEGSGMFIYPQGRHSPVDDYQTAINDRLKDDGKGHAKVILVESETQISELESAIKKGGIIPVRMQPLLHKRAKPTVAVATNLY